MRIRVEPRLGIRNTDLPEQLQGPGPRRGLGNPLGALLGGLILGALEGLLPLAMPNTWVPVIEFMLFVIILLVKPSGLFAR